DSPQLTAGDSLHRPIRILLDTGHRLVYPSLRRCRGPSGWKAGPTSSVGTEADGLHGDQPRGPPRRVESAQRPGGDREPDPDRPERGGEPQVDPPGGDEAVGHRRPGP